MLEQLIKIANEKYDGHFTILKFTSNYRVCFGTIFETATQTRYMAKGKTLDEAITEAINKNINDIDIDKQYRKDFKLNKLY